jgi:hypothetical protein
MRRLSRKSRAAIAASREARRVTPAHEPSEATTPGECECGRPKAEKTIACDRCSYLDGEVERENGSGNVAARLISAFRVLGDTATLDQLVEELGAAERNVYRALAILRGQGRVKTVLPPGADDLIPATYDRRAGRSNYEVRFGMVPDGRGGVRREYYFALTAAAKERGPNLAGAEGARPIYVLLTPPRRAA